MPTSRAKASISATGRPVIAGRPFRRARRKMRFEPVRVVGVFREIGAVGIALAEQHMHDGAGQRAVGAGLQHQAA